MSEEAAPGGDSATVEALRRVKAVEAEWAGRLNDARAEAEQAVRRAREEAAAMLKAVAAELDSERAHRLEQARASADRDAEAVRREGANAAEALRSQKGKRATGRTEEIVATVLGPLSGD